MFSALRGLLPAPLRQKLGDLLGGPRFFLRESYAQEGEDLVLARYFGEQQHGFYVDVGAHHPFRFSNTYLFYKRGWRGLNIDPRPDSKALFDRWRSRDINLQVGIATAAGQLELSIFNDEALNTFDPDLAASRDGKGGYRIVRKCAVPVMPLKALLEERWNASFGEIDFLNIDVEGYDDQVLASNDWSRFRPRIVLVEQAAATLGQALELKSTRYLQEAGYALCARTVNSTFFVRKDLLKAGGFARR